MKELIEKIIFFLLSMVLLFLIVRWALTNQETESPYVRFPNKIDTFR